MSDQASMFDTDDRRPHQRSTLELTDPSINTRGASHFRDGDEVEAAAARLVEPRTGTLRTRILDELAKAGRPTGKAGEAPVSAGGGVLIETEPSARLSHGRTMYELADSLGALLYSVGPRLTELRDAGWIVDSQQRRATPSGAKGIVWVLTPRGREAWNRMEGDE